MDQAGAGFHKPGQKQRLQLHVEAGQYDYIKEICSPEGFIFNPARLLVDCSALLNHSNQKVRSSLILKMLQREKYHLMRKYNFNEHRD